MTITAKEFQAFAQQRLVDAIATPHTFPERMKEVLNYAVDNESSMDDEAQASYLNLLNGISTMLSTG